LIPRLNAIHTGAVSDWPPGDWSISVGRVNSNLPVVLTLLADPELADNADRVAAAVGLRAVRIQTPNRKSWNSAAAAVIDEDGARWCTRSGMPRRDGVFVLGTSDPSPSIWEAAIEVGAQKLVVVPAQEAELVRYLAEAAEAGSIASRRGRVIAVAAGRGGGGASVFAAALAQSAVDRRAGTQSAVDRRAGDRSVGGEALLVDLDPCGGGIDLLLGTESAPGLRWPELADASGRLSWTAVREGLPRYRHVSVLSCTRTYHEIEAGAAAAIIGAGRRGGATVVCDMPRSLTTVALCALETADLVAIVTSCDVRGAAATSAVAGVIRSVNPNVGLVVRGPAPGGLRAGEVADIAAVPLLAEMRPEPMLDRQLEQRGIRLAHRSPLASAARKVLGTLNSGAGKWAA
jgi:secretion/DNA translocation related CpaE-like protein